MRPHPLLESWVLAQRASHSKLHIKPNPPPPKQPIIPTHISSLSILSLPLSQVYYSAHIHSPPSPLPKTLLITLTTIPIFLPENPFKSPLILLTYHVGTQTWTLPSSTYTYATPSGRPGPDSPIWKSVQELLFFCPQIKNLNLNLKKENIIARLRDIKDPVITTPTRVAIAKPGVTYVDYRLLFVVSVLELGMESGVEFEIGKGGMGVWANRKGIEEMKLKLTEEERGIVERALEMVTKRGEKKGR